MSGVRDLFSLPFMSTCPPTFTHIHSHTRIHTHTQGEEAYWACTRTRGGPLRWICVGGLPSKGGRVREKIGVIGGGS